VAWRGEVSNLNFARTIAPRTMREVFFISGLSVFLLYFNILFIYFFHMLGAGGQAAVSASFFICDLGREGREGGGGMG
jgi:hypothetical protein